MIPDGCWAVAIETYYIDGHIVTDYKVFVPDRTISGDYRHEFVTIRQPVYQES